MTSQKIPERLDEQLSEPESLDFDYAVLDAETRIFVQQRTSVIQTLIRHVVSSVFGIRQKLVQATASQIRKTYVFGFHTADSIFDIQQKLIQAKAGQIRKNYVFDCSSASALNSRLPVSFAASYKSSYSAWSFAASCKSGARLLNVHKMNIWT